VDLHLIVSSQGAGDTGGAPHPVLAALVDYQRLGREAGIARFQECAEHADPVVAALAKSMLAQTYVTLGAPRSAAAELLDEAAGCDDPLTLSHAAVLAWIIHADDAGGVIGLLRRAQAEGHPALAPWVAYALGMALQGRVHDDDPADADAEEALAAYRAVSDSDHPGLGVEGEARMLQILEGRGDLAGAAAVHERIVARGDRLRAPRSAWLLGYTRVRLDDLDAARAAFALVTRDHPELAAAGLFARRLLDHDFDGAAATLAAMPASEREDPASEREDPASEWQDGHDHRVVMATELLFEAAHAWQRAGETAAADAALSLVIAGVPRKTGPDRAQEAALFLGALRNDAGDHAGAAEAWARAAAGDDERRAAIGARRRDDHARRAGRFTGRTGIHPSHPTRDGAAAHRKAGP
jgi:tetratricopeptide (TPR) repeat protein